MKGLLLKDLYMIRHYYKSYLLIAVVFLILSVSDTGNLFFAFYPCLLCGMIPVNLLGYDARSRFTQFSATLPVTRAQFVSAKYLLGLCAQFIVLIVIGITQGIKMSVCGYFTVGEFTANMLSVLIISLLSAALPLPFIFKFGVEKGRVAYYVTIGFVCTSSVLFARFFKGGLSGRVPASTVFTVLFISAVGLYALSWYLSVIFFKKREL